MSLAVLDLAQTAGSAAEFEIRFLEQLGRDVGMDVAFFMTKHGGAAPTVVGLDPQQLRHALASGSMYERELLPVKRVALAQQGVAIDTEVLGAGAVRECAYHRDMAAPVGGRHTLMAYGRLRGEVTLALMLGRCGGPFREPERRAVEAILPGLSVARASFNAGCGSFNEGRGSIHGGPATELALLSAREREILDYLCGGYTNREIALACGTSPNTVRNQLVSVFGKLGVTTRAEAVAHALA